MLHSNQSSQRKISNLSFLGDQSGCHHQDDSMQTLEITTLMSLLKKSNPNIILANQSASTTLQDSPVLSSSTFFYSLSSSGSFSDINDLCSLTTTILSKSSAGNTRRSFRYTKLTKQYSRSIFLRLTNSVSLSTSLL
jgi:hypothetical protein